MTHDLIGKRVRFALHYHVGTTMTTRYATGTVVDVTPDVDVAREDDEQPRRLTLVQLSHVEGYIKDEVVVPLHDIVSYADVDLTMPVPFMN